MINLKFFAHAFDMNKVLTGLGLKSLIHPRESIENIIRYKFNKPSLCKKTAHAG